MSNESLQPAEDPSVFSPEKAAEWLRSSGVPDEAWEGIATFGLSNHWNRTLVDIALGTETYDVNERFIVLFTNEEHGPKRIENLFDDLNKNY